MKGLLHAGKFLALDMASTIFFVGLYALTRNIILAVAFGMVFGVVQIAWEFARKQPIDTMQWMSLFLVLSTGAATFFTRDPRFIMVKPSLIYVIVGIVMLKPGWMNRYLPKEAMELVPDIAVIFGYVWSALMFFSAALNLVLALNFPIMSYAAFMSAYAIASKLGLFAIQYAIMRAIAVRRVRAREGAGAATLAAA